MQQWEAGPRSGTWAAPPFYVWGSWPRVRVDRALELVLVFQRQNTTRRYAALAPRGGQGCRQA